MYKVRRAGRLDLQFFASGRRGKQARLRELANDDKLSSALRGEIRYELAHRRGYEARKGYGYEHSDIQTIRNHRTQHKYDRYGRRR
ncbi:polymorphic toxin type 8 domain-containing protein [Aeribacillus sp. FSL K6-1121]|uniref:polymorphic toxin type 8 domain-containing protein n=1 Tax=Aeribacillus sp. FSL K6-1121 TaxID=2954745 RepID=UPI0030F6586D